MSTSPVLIVRDSGAANTSFTHLADRTLPSPRLQESGTFVLPLSFFFFSFKILCGQFFFPLMMLLLKFKLFESQRGVFLLLVNVCEVPVFLKKHLVYLCHLTFAALSRLFPGNSLLDPIPLNSPRPLEILGLKFLSLWAWLHLHYLA